VTALPTRTLRIQIVTQRTKRLIVGRRQHRRHPPGVSALDRWLMRDQNHPSLSTPSRVP
jgi:hypothetical protein